jgi:acyl-CoA dehydrogenase
MGLPSAYYNDSHRKWQKTCRALVDELLMVEGGEWERAGDVPGTLSPLPLHKTPSLKTNNPESLYQKFAAANFLIPNLSAPLPIKWLHKLGITHLPGGLAVEDFDYLHTLIYVDEMARTGSLGPSGAITTGIAFGLPPILKFGSQALQERFVPDLITGKKRICIAITEPGAGSDVSNISTTAARSKDGKSFIVNGTKKWITNGLWSEYASMAVRTGGPGPGGLSMLVVPLLNTKGVSMRRIKVGGQTAAGTTFIELDDVVVPAENLIGKEGMGMKYVMQNFNHERLTISISVNRISRVALSAAFEYCLKREAFGKTLMEQPVVRHRLAKCGADLEAHWAWIEQFTYCMTKLSEEEANKELGGLTALAKAQAGRVVEVCASTAVLLFGGNGYTKSGQGEIAERMFFPLHPPSRTRN